MTYFREQNHGMHSSHVPLLGAITTLQLDFPPCLRPSLDSSGRALPPCVQEFSFLLAQNFYVWYLVPTRHLWNLHTRQGLLMGYRVITYPGLHWHGKMPSEVLAVSVFGAGRWLQNICWHSKNPQRGWIQIPPYKRRFMFRDVSLRLRAIVPHGIITIYSVDFTPGSFPETQWFKVVKLWPLVVKPACFK